MSLWLMCVAAKVQHSASSKNGSQNEEKYEERGCYKWETKLQKSLENTFATLI